jgi:two-component system, sensor histidine kinase and response regulator
MTNMEYASLEPFLNWPDLLVRVDHDSELIKELFMLLQEELPQLRNRLQNAINGGNLPEVEKAAHTLKGMLANLSVRQGTVLAASMEEAARNENLSEIQQAAVAFDQEIAQFLPALGEYLAST